MSGTFIRKSGLETGMIVELGLPDERYLVVGDVLISKTQSFHLAQYDNNLRNEEDEWADVFKVYAPKDSTDLKFENIYKLKKEDIIVDRELPKNRTVDTSNGHDKIIDFKESGIVNLKLVKRRLKTGMVVEVSNNEKFLVVGDYLVNEFNIVDISNYNEELNHQGLDWSDVDCSWADIVKVYKPSKVYKLSPQNYKYLETVDLFMERK